MNVVVSVMDQDKNTDVMVLVNNQEKTLTWIPRDLFSYQLRGRINRAFFWGGHVLLLHALKELDFQAEYSVCIGNSVCQEVFRNYQITVPIEHIVEYYYPLHAFTPIEQGKKVISFQPPYETLSGERIHQFLGARYRVSEIGRTDFPDFERIARQMLFIKQMLKEQFAFSVFIQEGTLISDPQALHLLAQVDATYTCSLYRDCKADNINGAWVFVQNSGVFMSMRIRVLKGYYLVKKRWKFLLNLVRRSYE